MKTGEKVTVEKTPSGLYAVTLPNGTKYIGAAPSTAIALTHAVFVEEASSTEVSRS